MSTSRPASLSGSILLTHEPDWEKKGIQRNHNISALRHYPFYQASKLEIVSFMTEKDDENRQMRWELWRRFQSLFRWDELYKLFL